MYFQKFLVSLFFIISFIFSAKAQEVNSYIYKGEQLRIGKNLRVLKDESSQMSLRDVIQSEDFEISKQDLQNFGITPHAYWVNFKIINKSNEKNLSLEIPYTLIDSISFFQVNDSKEIEMENHAGNMDKFDSRMLDEHQYYVYPLIFDGSDSVEVYLRVKSGTQLMLPIKVGSQYQILGDLLKKDLFFGIYFGIIIVMVLYNLFVYLSLRDYSYLLYILFLLSVLFTQASLDGYISRFILPENPLTANWIIYFSSALIGIMAIIFAQSFLNTKKESPIYHKLGYVFIIIYLITSIMPLFGFNNASYGLILMSAALSAIYVLFIAFNVLRKGSRPAKYFLAAWSVFILTVIIFVLKDYGVLPYNFFTAQALQFGSAFEAVILSFALADKINVYREEKDSYQQQALDAIRKNEIIISEQKTKLEIEVKKRTQELQNTNKELNATLKHLQDTQIQLVESEKMASLGQLTAGIAHEINNPINFVTSNVTPLKRDISMLQKLLEQIEEIALSDLSIDDKKAQIKAFKQHVDFEYLQTEIDFLLKGISEGANRTSDIVKGLRLFSRLDEDDVKMADLNEGLDSTIAIVNHLTNGVIQIEKNYGSIPLVNCYPGKLNQIFLNMMTNAIHAIQSKWGNESGGILTFTTYVEESHVVISIKDNGSGMSEKTKKKLFEPFFTTKEVGVGTGLGMSIAWNTVKKHNGEIKVSSVLGEGTEFKIYIPLNQEFTQNN